MCGLVGIAGDLEFKDEATLRRLLLVDYIRGTDSTGLGAVRQNGKVYISKIASHPIDLFDMGTFKAALSGYNSTVFMGHNRAATLGKVNGLNAHPFQFDHILGCHNGTLDQASWGRLQEASGVETDVDSAAIFACIAKIGVKDTIALMEEGSTSARGAWALVWHDANENTINFLRNKHRPLWYSMTKKLDKIVWASQYPMISAALDLGKEDEYSLYSTKDDACFFEFAEDWLYSFKLDDLIKGYDKKPSAKIKKLKGRQPVAVSTVGSAGSPPFTIGGGTTTTMGTANGGTTGDNKSHNWIPTGDHVTVLGNAVIPLGGYMDKQEFEAFSKFGGCAWCGKEVNFDDVGIAVYEQAQVVLCSEHSGNEGHNRVYADPTKYNEFLKYASVV